MSDPGVKIPPPRHKKYHRRGPWACDECRLRKRKCDGLRPCGPCNSTDYSCTYESREPTLGPTQRIRLLEDKLRHARLTLQRLISTGVDTANVDLDSAIRALESGSLLEPPFACTSNETGSKSQIIDSMMGGCGYLINRQQNSGAFFGAFSGVSFICRTLELFLKTSETLPSTINIHPSIFDLFDTPMPEKLRLHTYLGSLQDLPGRETTLRILDFLFSRCSLVAQFLQHADILWIIDRVYQPLYSQRALVLVHSLLAVGYLYHVPLHRTQGCRAVVDEALRHFSLARRAIDITQCNDMMTLQTLLCIIIFLITTCRIMAAHPYIGVACSSAMKLGLHCRSLESLHLSHEQRQTRIWALITILKLDMYSSIVLGLPPFVDLQGRYRDLAISDLDLSSASLEIEGRLDYDDAIRLELSTKHLELLKITTSGLYAVFPKRAESGDEICRAETLFPVNIKNLEQLQSQLQQWAQGFSSFVPHMGDSPKFEIFKYELEIAYYFGQIIVHQPFLHYLKRIVDREALSLSQSRQALACIKISSITITRSEEMMKRRLICSASWMSVYSIFSAVVCLTFLIAAHNGTSKPTEAWKKAQSGIKLLAAARCRDDGATACLGLLKKLTAELSHTVDFDIEQIESSTIRLCQNTLVQSEPANDFESVMLPNDPWSPSLAEDIAESFVAFRDSSAVFGPSSLWREHSTTQMNGETDSLTPVAFPCDADEILAQAQGISLGHDMDKFISVQMSMMVDDAES